MLILLLGTGYVGVVVLHAWQREDLFIATTTSPKRLPEIQALPKVREARVLWGSNTLELKQTLDVCDGAIITVAPRKGLSYEETYLGTALAVHEGLRGRQAPLHLVYTSSTSVYGDHGSQAVTEQSELRGNAVLIEAERRFHSCSSEHVSVSILRLGGLYGPERTLEARALRLSGRQVSGAPNAPTNHSHRDDVVAAIEFSFRNRLSGIYNVVGNEHPTRQVLYERLCHSLAVEAPKWAPAESPGRGSNALVLSDKIKAEGFLFSAGEGFFSLQ